jgi:hypothetical protein
MVDKKNDNLYGACVYPLKSGCSELLIFSVDDVPEGDPYFQIRSEIYRTTFWDVCPDARGLATAIVESFSRCHVPTIPVELVYEFGGEIHNTEFSVRYASSVNFMRLH